MEENEKDCEHKQLCYAGTYWSRQRLEPAQSGADTGSGRHSIATKSRIPETNLQLSFFTRSRVWLIDLEDRGAGETIKSCFHKCPTPCSVWRHFTTLQTMLYSLPIKLFVQWRNLLKGQSYRQLSRHLSRHFFHEFVLCIQYIGIIHTVSVYRYVSNNIR